MRRKEKKHRRVRVSLSIQARLIEAIRRIAEEENKSVSRWVEDALMERVREDVLAPAYHASNYTGATLPREGDMQPGRGKRKRPIRPHQRL